MRPVAIDGSPGERIQLVLGRSGDDFVVVFNSEDENSSWQSHYWDLGNLKGIPQQMRKHMNDCRGRGGTVSMMTIDPQHLFWCLHLEESDGCDGYWWSHGHVQNLNISDSGFEDEDTNVSFGDEKQVLLYGASGHRSWNCNKQLLTRMERIRKKWGTIDFVKLLPCDGYYISDSDGAQADCGAGGLPLKRELLNDLQGPVLDVVVAQDGSWVVIRVDSFNCSRGVSSKLVKYLTEFYRRQHARAASVNRSIALYEKALLKRAEHSRRLREKQRRQEAEKKRAEEERLARERVEKQRHVEEQRRQEAEKKRAEQERLARENAEKQRRLEEQRRQEAENRREQERIARELALEEERARRTRDERIRVSQIQCKGFKRGDHATAIEHSTAEGDVVVCDFDKNGVVVCRDSEHFTITDPRLITAFQSSPPSSSESDSKMLILLLRAYDKYEAAVSFLRCECHDGACSCSRIAQGNVTMERLASWRRNDCVLQREGSAIHVQLDALQHIIGQFSVLQVFEHRGEVAKFDEYKCAEKIDLRRLKHIVDDLEEDGADRKRYMNHLRELMEDYEDKKHRGEWNVRNTSAMKEALRLVERCHSLQATSQALYDMLKDLPTDQNGCVVYEVKYEHRDPARRGRLFACGKTVDKGLDGKVARTATLQGIHSDLRAPLVGKFAHDIDCQNSDMHLLCSLADQLDLTGLIPALLEYRDHREIWLQRIMIAHNVLRKTAKRLSTIVVSGGRYSTWLKNASADGTPLEPRPEINQFVFKLTSQLAALRDELVTHPRFQWIDIDVEKLRNDGKSVASIDAVILARIVLHCENEVLSILHRSFHQQGWIVRAKVFDGLIVEEDVGRSKTGSADVAMRTAEAACRERGWDIRLEEKPLFGRQDEDIETVTLARQTMARQQWGSTHSTLASA